MHRNEIDIDDDDTELCDLPCININHTLASSRIYYVNGEFHGYTNTLKDVSPFRSKFANNVAEYLYTLLKNDKNVDLTIYYPSTFNIKKKQKIKSLMGKHENADKHTYIKFLLLLI